MTTSEKLVVSENLLKRLLTALEKQTRKDNRTILQLFNEITNENPQNSQVTR